MSRVVFVVCCFLFLTSWSAVAFAEGKIDYEVGKVLTHNNLSVAPLYAKGAKAAGQKYQEYLTFSEATKLGVIKVTELNGKTSDAEVSAVHIQGSAKLPIFIMAGEVILGGKQDRIISDTTVIEPGDPKLKVAVFCVEHGRWAGQTSKFNASGKIGHRKLRTKASFDKDQGQVWGEVAAQNKKTKVAPKTETYKASLKQQKQLTQSYIKVLSPPLRADRLAVGLIVAIDGKTVSVDAFANPKLFSKLRPALIESYAFEAATSKGADGKTKYTTSTKEFSEFLVQAQKATKKRPRKRSGKAETSYGFSDSIKSTKTSTRRKKVYESIQTY